MKQVVYICDTCGSAAAYSYEAQTHKSESEKRIELKVSTDLGEYAKHTCGKLCLLKVVSELLS